MDCYIKYKLMEGIIVKKYNVAIVGATGMVGRTFLKVLEEMQLPVENYYLLASKRSAGQKIDFMGKEYVIEELNENSFDKDIDIALFSAGGSTSEKFAPIAASKGVVVIDNSSAWRMDPKVPLVVPEVNPQDIEWNNGIIANPNCSTIQAMVALKPLHDKYKIKRIVYSTYQAVSGAGLAGYMDLENGLKGEAPKKFPHPSAGNCLPHMDVFLPNGYTEEEMKNSIPDRDAAVEIANEPLHNYYKSGSFELAPGKTKYIALIVRMPEEIGNVANYRDDTEPKVELGITVKADQITD